MKKRITTATVAVLAAGIIPSSAQASYPIRECGDMPRYDVTNVTTRRFSCREARQIIRFYAARGEAPNMNMRRRSISDGVDVRMWRYSWVLRFQMHFEI